MFSPGLCGLIEAVYLEEADLTMPIDIKRMF